jgi:hypothetical protein
VKCEVKGAPRRGRWEVGVLLFSIIIFSVTDSGYKIGFKILFLARFFEPFQPFQPFQVSSRPQRRPEVVDQIDGIPFFPHARWFCRETFFDLYMHESTFASSLRLDLSNGVLILSRDLVARPSSHRHRVFINTCSGSLGDIA